MQLFSTIEESLRLNQVDVGNANAAAFYNGGKFSLEPEVPGAVDWPGGAPPAVGAAMSAEVTAILPAALGRFISTLPGAVVNISCTSFTLFHFLNANAVSHATSIESFG